MKITDDVTVRPHSLIFHKIVKTKECTVPEIQDALFGLPWSLRVAEPIAHAKDDKCAGARTSSTCPATGACGHSARGNASPYRSCCSGYSYRRRDLEEEKEKEELVDFRRCTNK